MHWLKFLRISALPSALADVFGGTALAMALLPAWAMGAHWPRVGWLLLATTGIYLGGMGLNDLLHVRKDLVLGKNRPVAMGYIGFRPALGLTLLLYLTGLAAAAAAGVFWPAFALVLLTAAYNDLAAAVNPSPPRAIAGVIVLALCRVLHVALPLFAFSRGAGLAATNAGIIAALFFATVFVYFVLVIVVSLFEDRGGGERALAVIQYAQIPVVLALPLVVMVSRPAAPLVGVVLPLVVLAVLLGELRGVLAAARNEPTPRNLGRVVGQGLRGECLLMAAFALVLAPQAPWWGLAALACYPVARALAAVVSPT